MICLFTDTDGGDDNDSYDMLVHKRLPILIAYVERNCYYHR